MIGLDFYGGACGDGLSKLPPASLGYEASDFSDEDLFVA